MAKRKSPRLHTVRKHKRDGKTVHSYKRGKGSSRRKRIFSSLRKRRGKNLIVPRTGKPREEIKNFPIGSYAIFVDRSYFTNGGRYIERRKRPLYYVAKITGFIDIDSHMGNSGLRYSGLLKHHKKFYDLDKAIAYAERKNEDM